MGNTAPFEKYNRQYDELITLVKNANYRVIRENPDEYIYHNANFFIKSFLVVACTYLETYIKEVCELVIEKYERLLVDNPIPHNLIRWGIDSFPKDKDLKFDRFKLGISKKDIDSNISGNVYKTISLFTRMGIDIITEDNFRDNKDIVGTIVNKRNNIVHHNDDASDVSFTDIIRYIGIFKVYMKAIDDKVMTEILS